MLYDASIPDKCAFPNSKAHTRIVSDVEPMQMCAVAVVLWLLNVPATC